MNAVIAALVSLFLGSALYVLFRKSSFFRRAVLLGATTWSRFLPVIASVVLAFLMIDGLIVKSLFGPDLAATFGQMEMFLILVAALLSLFRFGNIFGFALTGYLFAVLAMPHTLDAALASALLLSATTLMMLSDRIPWYPRQENLLLARAKVVTTLAATVFSLLFLVTGIFKVTSLARWLYVEFSVPFIPYLVFLALGLLVFAWMSISFEIVGKFLIFAILPASLIVLSFISGAPTFLFALPFGIFLAAAISIGEVKVTRIPTY